MKDKDLAALRKKEQSFRSTVESIQIQLDNESKRNQDLEQQVIIIRILSVTLILKS